MCVCAPASLRFGTVMWFFPDARCANVFCVLRRPTAGVVGYHLHTSFSMATSATYIVAPHAAHRTQRFLFTDTHFTLLAWPSTTNISRMSER
uniref:Putative secreted protein n=1 Tax=Anopheles darlingi TaxID=43151 RepID=A0A2M4DCB4_ANODA